MRKFAVISVLLFLASGVFADISFSGIVGSGATMLQGKSASDSSLQANGFLWGRLQVNASDADNTLGAVLRLQTGFATQETPYYFALQDPNAWSSYSNYTNVWQTYNPYAWAWWKPIKQVKLQLGFLDAFATNEIVGWDFNSNDAEDFIAQAGYFYSGDIFHRSTGFYNGTWWTGAAVSIYPISGLAINIGIPFTRGNLTDPTATAKDVYGYMLGQVTYDIPRIGRASLTVTGGTTDGYTDNDWYTLGPKNITTGLKAGGWTIDSLYENAPIVYGAFLLKALADKGIGINIGVAYTMPTSGNAAPIPGPGSIPVTYYSPIAAGLGFSYMHGKFDLKVRCAATFAGYTKTPNVAPVYDPLKLGLGIMPSYDFGICKVYLNAGVSFKGYDDTIDPNNNAVSQKAGTSAFGWHIQPYASKMIGGVIMYAGFYLASNVVYAENDRVINWGIPVGVEYGF